MQFSSWILEFSTFLPFTDTTNEIIGGCSQPQPTTTPCLAIPSFNGPLLEMGNCTNALLIIQGSLILLSTITVLWTSMQVHIQIRSNFVIQN